MKEAMVRGGDDGKRIFMGEFGYSTTETFMPAIPDATRALYLERAFEIARSQPYVSGLSWYGFVPGDSTGTEWTLLDEALMPNETYQAYSRASRTEERGEKTSGEPVVPQPLPQSAPSRRS